MAGLARALTLMQWWIKMLGIRGLGGYSSRGALAKATTPAVMDLSPPLRPTVPLHGYKIYSPCIGSISNRRLTHLLVTKITRR